MVSSTTILVYNIILTVVVGVGLGGNALYWSYKSRIDGYTANCVLPYLPILNINVVDGLSNNMFILTAKSFGTFGVETYGNSFLSNSSDIVMNEGYELQYNPENGMTGWKVPSPGIYRVSTFITGYCAIYSSGNDTAINGTCGISNMTEFDATFSLIPFYTTNINLNFTDVNILDDLNAFLGSYDQWNGVFGDTATPSMRVHAKTNSFTSLVNITDIDTEFIVGGVFTFNSNYAVKILHRYFSVQKIK
jgi:hypothetical protein